MPRRPDRHTYPALFFSALVIVGLASCREKPADAPAPPPAAPAATESAALRPLPALDLSQADASARAQLEAARARLDGLPAGAADPERAEAYGDLGRLYLTYELRDAAALCFANALSLAPRDARWTYLDGYLKLLGGDPAGAAARFEEVLGAVPDDLPTRLRLGQARLDQDDAVAARAAFARAVELSPSSPAAHEGLGKAAVAAGELAEATGHFERALALDPQATAIHYALGQTHRALGDLDRARFHLERSGDVPARFEDPLINPLAELAEGVQFYLRQGAEALDDRDFAAAAGAYQGALAREPGQVEAGIGLAFALEQQGDLDGAAAGLAGALLRATPPQNAAAKKRRVEALARLGALEAARGRDEEALARYEAALALDPAHPAALLRAADALARRGRFADAVALYDRLLVAVPEAAPAILEKRATAQVNLGRRKAAIADFRRAISAVPGDARLRLRFAAALEFLGDHADAERERAEAVRLGAGGDERARLAYEEARTAAARGDLAAAEKGYREVLAAAPDQTAVRGELAALLGRSGRFDEAAAEFERVLAADPRNAAVRKGQIAALVLGGRFGMARVKLQEALREFPRDAELALTQVRLLATAPDPEVRDGALALDIARRVAADRDDPAARAALALALAEAGRPGEAAEVQRRLLTGSPSSAAPLLEARLAAFEQGRGWVAADPAEILSP